MSHSLMRVTLTNAQRLMAPSGNAAAAAGFAPVQKRRGRRGRIPWRGSQGSSQGNASTEIETA
jgi:hypothetical protein